MPSTLKPPKDHPQATKADFRAFVNETRNDRDGLKRLDLEILKD